MYALILLCASLEKVEPIASLEREPNGACWSSIGNGAQWSSVSSDKHSSLEQVEPRVSNLPWWYVVWGGYG